MRCHIAGGESLAHDSFLENLQGEDDGEFDESTGIESKESLQSLNLF